MGQVYQNSSCRLIWLGEGGYDELDSVKWFLEALRETPERRTDLNPTSFRIGSQDTEPLRERLRMLGSLLSRSWFNRGWTTQEVCLARHAVMLVGRNRLDWSELLNLYKNLHKNARYLAQRIFYCDYLSAKSKIARSLRLSRLPDVYGEVLPFSYVLSLSHSEETTDPKDKVYAALALADEPIRHSIVVKYSDTVSVEQVYTEATRAIIAHEKRYSVLSQTESYRRGPKLPSWVPDWRVKRLAQSMFAAKYFPGVAQGSKAIVTETRTPSLYELHVPAHSIGQVVTVHDLESFRSDLDSSAQYGWPRMAAAVVRLASRVTLDHRTLFPDTSFYLAILRTLSADTLPFSNRIGNGMRCRHFPLHRDTLLNGTEFTETTSAILSDYYATMLQTSYLNENPQTGHSKQLSRAAPFAHIDDTLLSSAMQEITRQISIHTSCRSLFITTEGRMGLSCTSTTIEDEVYCFQGGATPFVLRPMASLGTFELVAECYLDRVMKGELYNLEGEGDRRRLVPKDGGKFGEIILI